MRKGPTSVDSVLEIRPILVSTVGPGELQSTPVGLTEFWMFATDTTGTYPVGYILVYRVHWVDNLTQTNLFGSPQVRPLGDTDCHPLSETRFDTDQRVWAQTP